jgi:hypothetical protein
MHTSLLCLLEIILARSLVMTLQQRRDGAFAFCNGQACYEGNISITCAR